MPDKELSELDKLLRQMMETPSAANRRKQILKIIKLASRDDQRAVFEWLNLHFKEAASG